VALSFSLNLAYKNYILKQPSGMKDSLLVFDDFSLKMPL